MVPTNTLKECVDAFLEYEKFSEEVETTITKYIQDHKYYLDLKYHRDFSWSEAYSNFLEYFAQPVMDGLYKTKLPDKLGFDYVEAFIKVVEVRERFYSEIPKYIMPVTAETVCRYLLWIDAIDEVITEAGFFGPRFYRAKFRVWWRARKVPNKLRKVPNGRQFGERHDSQA